VLQSARAHVTNTTHAPKVPHAPPPSLHSPPPLPNHRATPLPTCSSSSCSVCRLSLMPLLAGPLLPSKLLLLLLPGCCSAQTAGRPGHGSRMVAMLR
jgi:hypothetical protein